MKISLNKSLAAALLMGTISFQAMAADNVATVNGKPIKQSLYDYIVKEANARGQNIDENTRKVIVDKLIASELVFQEAQRQGIDNIPTISQSRSSPTVSYWSIPIFKII